MAGLLIVGDTGAVRGFRLGGFDCMEAGDVTDMDTFIERLMTEDRYGLVFIVQEMFDKISERVMLRLRKRGLPVVLPLDIPREWGGAETAEAHIARLIKRAVGYQIKIKR